MRPDLGVEGFLETDDGFVVLLGIRPLQNKLVDACLDVVEEEFDILFDVKERTDGVAIRGDDVDEHGDLGVHSLEPAAQTLEARKFGNLFGREGALKLVGVLKEGLSPVLGETPDRTIGVRLTKGTSRAAQRRVCDRVPGGLSRGRLPVSGSCG